MKYIDIHCHLDFPDYGDEIVGVLERMKLYDISAITIGTDLESSKRAVEIAEENDNVWACIGVHPYEALSFGEGWEGLEFEKLVQSPKVVGIGECGLDYFRIKTEEEKIKQKDLFIKQIEFALKHDKPLMLHCRNAYGDVLDILKNYPGVKGNCHFFAGNVEEARKFLDLGFTVSFTGVVTFTSDYDEVIRFLPTDSIMSETDAPFVAPVPHRGKRNEPVFVVEIVKKLAEIRAENEKLLNEAIINNARRVFGI